MSVISDVRQRDVTNKPENVNGKIANGQEEVIMDTPLPVKRRPKPGKIDQVQETCTICCIPCLTSHNPLPEYPSLFERFRHGLMLPLHGNLATYIQFGVVCLQLWIILYTLTHGQAMPEGNFFSLLILFIGCAIGGYFISFLRLPPLLGMLIAGILLNNVPTVKIIGENIDNGWSKALRKLALTVILTRAGLGLDIIKLRKLSWAVLRLAFLPCTAEIITVGIVSHFILGFPWKWSIMLGCILGALSPAVTVPSLVNLQDRQYGVAKGIPTMLLAAGGLDNVLCVTGFSVFFGIIFSKGDLTVTILKGPLGVFVGVVYGFVAGVFLWYIPSKDCVNKVFYRTLLLFGFGMIAIFGSSEIELSGAGPLGCLTTATVAGYKWRQRRKQGEQDEVSGVMALVWLIAQHFLFGLIGTAVNVGNIEPSTAGWGILTLAIGLVVRSAVDFTVTFRTGFNMKERVFITLTWLSKATVQAAIGGWALDEVSKSVNPAADDLKYATDILTISVLAIIICAPTGATLMAVLGPKFLVKGEIAEESIEVCTVDNDGRNTPVKMFDMTQAATESNEMAEIPHKANNLNTLPVESGEVVEVPVYEMEKKLSHHDNDVTMVPASNELDVDVSSKPEVPPECYKSQLIVTLSNAENKDTEYIIHSNMFNSDVSMAGIDNPAFAKSETDNVKGEGPIETDNAKDEGNSEIDNFNGEGQIETDNSKSEGQTDDDKHISVLEQTDINKEDDVDIKINSEIKIDDNHETDDDKETGGDKLIDIDQQVDKRLDKQSDNDKYADDDKQNYTDKHNGGDINNDTDIKHNGGDINNDTDIKHNGGDINNDTDIKHNVGDIISIGISKF